MNLMGMGIPEVGVIMLVAFLVLGPGRSIDMARNAGKLLGDLRRSFNDVTRAVTIEADQFTSTQSRNQDPATEPPPGVPVRPDTPSQEEDESDGLSPDSARPQSEDKG
ncbi:MAG: twin-arginine translocase TatA/TatE family subunit [Chloroflexi bacterium]|nr:twin-arginine translocase TatA/TatE family subunit [Chloroflexota bacterium]